MFDLTLLGLMIVFFIIMACPIWLFFIMKWEEKKKMTKMKMRDETPAEFFANCDDDTIKMLDKVLNCWPRLTWSQFIFVQKRILIDVRKVLEREHS